MRDSWSVNPSGSTLVQTTVHLTPIRANGMHPNWHAQDLIKARQCNSVAAGFPQVKRPKFPTWDNKVKKHPPQKAVTFSLPTARPMRLMHSMVLPRRRRSASVVAFCIMYLRQGMNLQQHKWSGPQPQAHNTVTREYYIIAKKRSLCT